MDQGLPEDDCEAVLHELALALLELIGREVDIELDGADSAPALAASGTLLRAFEPPFPTSSPTLSLMIGPNCIGIRLAGIERVVCRREPRGSHGLLGLHVLLSGGGALHLHPLRD